MTRGRKRKYDPTIPKHIDQNKIPAGVYWRFTTTNNAKTGVWWMRDAEGKKKNIATEVAMLSDLHAISESDSGQERGTVEFVLDSFHESTEFKSLAAGTKTNYKLYAKYLKAYPTKLGVTFGTLKIDRLTLPVIQRLIEVIGKSHPTKANHLLRYMRRTFNWGMRHGECKSNPAKGVRQCTEAKQFKMPTQNAFNRILQFARDRGSRVAHSDGSVAPYLAPVMQLAYYCRLRGIEVCTLSDANALEIGIQSNRRKGSLDTITEWNADMRAAWSELQDIRKKTTDRASKPVQLKPENRYLVVSQSGDPLVKSSFDSAWQRMIKMAIVAKVITEAERFSLHGLKHRGVTDTEGTRAEQKDASGHKSDAAFNIYQHGLQTVKPPKKN